MTKTSTLMCSCLLAGIALDVFAQNRRHDQIMKNVATTFTALGKVIESGNETETASNAAKLAALFKEVEAFWMPFRSRIAASGAQEIQMLSQKVAAAAAAKDIRQAEELYKTIGASCRNCHDRHRLQMPDNSYRIKP